MKNVLNIANFSGSQIKQGDKSLIRIKLYNNRNNEDIEGLSAKVTLALGNKVVYKADSGVHGGYVDFRIDKVIPVGAYELEIVVDGRYIFPSDTKAIINVVKSHEQLMVDEMNLQMTGDLVDAVLEKVKEESQFTHTQQVASSEWIIEHKLGKYPAVTVVDSTGREIVGNVTYTSKQKVVLNFAQPFSGCAYFN